MTDDLGNRQVLTEERLDNTFNAYTTVGGVAHTYDPNGNLTSDGARMYKWDAFNRLREVTTTTGTLIAKYAYDADGRRIRKTLGPAATAGVSTDYKYNGWQIVEESAPTSATPRTQYVYGKGIDEVLAKDENRDGDMTCTGTSDAREFPLQTDTYSLAATFVPGVGIVEAFEFNPYGPAVRLTDGNDDGVVNFDDSDVRTSFDPTTPGRTFATLYGGHPLDEETGLTQMRDRYYSVVLGRFVSEDSIQLPVGPVWGSVAALMSKSGLSYSDPLRETEYADGLNLLGYARNSPTNATDPLGLLTLDTGGFWGRNCSQCGNLVPLDKTLVSAVGTLKGLTSTQMACMSANVAKITVQCYDNGSAPCYQGPPGNPGPKALTEGLTVKLCFRKCLNQGCGPTDMVNILVHELAHTCGLPAEYKWPKDAVNDPVMPEPWGSSGVVGKNGTYPCTGK
jgi:RHS repeat-associated protein